MVIAKEDIDKNITRIATQAMNGDGSLFSNLRKEEYDKAVRQVKSDAEFRHVTLTDTQIENAAKTEALKSMSAKLKGTLNAAEAAGDDKTNMIGFVMDMAFGGGANTGSMIMNIIKGESPFWKTVKESFSGDGSLMDKVNGFTDKWKENVQKASLDKFAEKHGVSSDELIAELSKTNQPAVQLVLAKEPLPVPQLSAEQQARLESEKLKGEEAAKKAQEKQETDAAVEKALKGMRIDAAVQHRLEEEKAKLSKGEHKTSGGAHLENGTTVTPGAVSSGGTSTGASKG